MLPISVFADTLSNEPAEIPAWQEAEDNLETINAMEDDSTNLKNGDEIDDISTTPVDGQTHEPSNESVGEPIQPFATPVAFYFTYKQTSKSTATGGWTRISRIINGPGSVSVSTSTTKKESFTSDMSLTAELKKKVRAGASFTWYSSATSSIKETDTFYIPKGKKGYVGLKPFYNVSNGNLYRKHSVTGNVVGTYKVVGKSPKKLNGHLDGEVSRRYV